MRSVMGCGTYLGNLSDEHFALLLIVRLWRRGILAVGRREVWWSHLCILWC